MSEQRSGFSNPVEGRRPGGLIAIRPRMHPRLIVGDSQQYVRLPRSRFRSGSGKHEIQGSLEIKPSKRVSGRAVFYDHSSFLENREHRIRQRLPMSFPIVIRLLNRLTQDHNRPTRDGIGGRSRASGNDQVNLCVSIEKHFILARPYGTNRETARLARRP
tara:strand:- start:29 stop:508 length:480 start_codon:yes stop_codon:yes gene_type:complete